jgi:hypothetical protein
MPTGAGIEATVVALAAPALRSNAAPSAAAEGQRSSGSFARPFASTSSIHAGSSARRVLTATGEWQSPGEHLEQDGRQAVHIRTTIHGVTGQLLGRGVGHGSEELVRRGETRLLRGLPEIGNAEVHQLVRALATLVLVGDDVGRLDVAVDDFVAVSQLQGRADPRHDPVDILEVHPGTEVELLAQTGPAEELHDKVRLPPRQHVEIEDGNNRRMPQARGNPAFAEETMLGCAFAVIAEDDLDRDLVAKQRAPGPVHGSHSALGKRRQDLVLVVEDIACRQHVPSLDHRR